MRFLRRLTDRYLQKAPNTKAQFINFCADRYRALAYKQLAQLDEPAIETVQTAIEDSLDDVLIIFNEQRNTIPYVIDNERSEIIKSILAVLTSQSRIK